MPLLSGAVIATTSKIRAAMSLMIAVNSKVGSLGGLRYYNVYTKFREDQSDCSKVERRTHLENIIFFLKIYSSSLRMEKLKMNFIIDSKKVQCCLKEACTNSKAM